MHVPRDQHGCMAYLALRVLHRAAQRVGARQRQQQQQVQRQQPGGVGRVARAPRGRLHARRKRRVQRPQGRVHQRQAQQPPQQRPGSRRRARLCCFAHVSACAKKCESTNHMQSGNHTIVCHHPHIYQQGHQELAYDAGEGVIHKLLSSAAQPDSA